MLKLVADHVLALDAEWVPCASTGRRLYGLPDAMPDIDVMQVMWAQAGGTPENPRPYLKTAVCRIVSVSAVSRQRVGGGVKLDLISLPRLGEEGGSERTLLDRFFSGVGRLRPQLVGFNSLDADLPALLQRALSARIAAPAFSQRPNKPWEGIDYFAKGSDYHVDLKRAVGGFGKATPSLAELCAACGIPGKLGVDGGDVVDLFLANDIRSIVRYNDHDALSTYLLWLRIALFGGFVTPDEAAAEEELLAMLRTRGIAPENDHLLMYLAEWDRLAA